MLKKMRNKTNKLLVLMAVAYTVAAWGCSKEEQMNSKTNLVAESVLAPKLLPDKEEIKKFVADFPQKDYGVFTVPGVGKFYVDDNPALVKQQIKAGKPWEPEGIKLLTQYAVPGTTALDIGAHIGSLALVLGRAVGPDGVVYAFEPQKKIYRELVKNLELNNIKNIIALRFAVGSEPGVIEMTSAVQHDGTKLRDGTMSVGQGGDKAELRSIDSFNFSNVSLMKIDVEGYELQVLKGAQRTIEKWHPAILLEISQNQNEVNAFFKQNGYGVTFAYESGAPHFMAIHK